MRRVFRAVSLALVVLLALLFVIGYSARYVHPRYGWWAELVAVGLPYLSAAVVLTLLVALAGRWWRVAGVYALLAVLVAARFLPPGGVPRWKTPSPDALTLLTFNVPHWGGQTPEYERRAALEGGEEAAPVVDAAATYASEAPPTLGAFIRQVEPQLVTLQETWVRYAEDAPRMSTTSGHLASLIDTLNYDVAQVRGGHRVSMLPVLGHVQFLSQEHLPLPDPAGTDTSFAVRTRFVWQGREAVLYNLHLRSFGSNKPWEESRGAPFSPYFWRRYLRQYRSAYRARADEAKAVRAMIEAETLPVLVAGDFNSTPHSWVYATISEGMQDAYKVAGWGWGATYHAQLPFVRIDFVLAGPEWEVLAAEVPDVNLSDHRPLLTHLRWREAP